MYIQAMWQRHASFYEDLVASLKSATTAIAKLSKGYLHPEIFTLLKLKTKT